MNRIFSIWCVLLLIASAPSSNAADEKKQAAPSKGKKELTTNVVGSQEAPTVLNVVPWKEREVRYERKSPISSILEQSLQPLDRDVVMREIQYHDSLQAQRSP